MLARGSFQSTSSDGQSRLMKPPSDQKAKMLAGELYLAITEQNRWNLRGHTPS